MLTKKNATQHMKRIRFFCFKHISFFKACAFAADTKTGQNLYGHGVLKLFKRNDKNDSYISFSAVTITNPLPVLTSFQIIDQNIFHRKNNCI